MAGISAAAALREFGWSVLIVEPGQRNERRLSGELIHPFGVAALNELGIASASGFAGATAVDGFVVFPGDHHAAPISLPYAGGRGLALDHARIRTAFQQAADALPYVRTQNGRVVAIESDGSRMLVAVQDAQGLRNLSCRLAVAADGASSAVRSHAGISHTRKAVSKITGFLITGENLPVAGSGHVFIGSLAPLLVYEIGGGRARVLFDQPLDQADLSAVEHRARLAEAIPHPQLRAEVIGATQAQRGLSFISADVIASCAARGRVALVGDAGGSCHPLTATGMTVGTADALRLRDAFRESSSDIPAGLALYARWRRAPQRTRLLVASTLHEACSGRSPESQLIRTGLIRYWTSGSHRRRASMAILAMSDVRIASTLREMLLVVLYGLSTPWKRWSITRIFAVVRLSAGVAGLVIRQMSFAMRVR